MFNSNKKIAEKLGLKDIGKVKVGTIVGPTACGDCNTPLRLGEKKVDKWREKKVAKETFTYCPKCIKIVYSVSMDRFPPGIKVAPHDD